VAESEMHRTFNCGIGFVVIVAEADAARTTEVLRAQGQTVYAIGRIEVRQGDEAPTQVA
jgi:phosphoribosylformylglycinamidine cyclo-ligase